MRCVSRSRPYKVRPAWACFEKCQYRRHNNYIILVWTTSFAPALGGLCVCVCVRARACVRARVRACVRVCMCVCVYVFFPQVYYDTKYNIYIIREEASIFAPQMIPFYKDPRVAACTVGKVRSSTVFMCVCSTFRPSDFSLFVKNGFVVGVRCQGNREPPADSATTPLSH